MRARLYCACHFPACALPRQRSFPPCLQEFCSRLLQPRKVALATSFPQRLFAPVPASTDADQSLLLDKLPDVAALLPASSETATTPYPFAGAIARLRSQPRLGPCSEPLLTLHRSPRNVLHKTSLPRFLRRVRSWYVCARLRRADRLEHPVSLLLASLLTRFTPLRCVPLLTPYPPRSALRLLPDSNRVGFCGFHRRPFPVVGFYPTPVSRCSAPRALSLHARSNASAPDGYDFHRNHLARSLALGVVREPTDAGSPHWLCQLHRLALGATRILRPRRYLVARRLHSHDTGRHALRLSPSDAPGGPVPPLAPVDLPLHRRTDGGNERAQTSHDLRHI
jgi:hypothetical protein